MRLVVLGLLTLWLLGVAANTVDLLGLILASVSLATLLGFAAALGLFFSVRSRSTWRAQGLTMALMFLLNGGYLMCTCWFVRNAWSSLVLVGCSPVFQTMALLSPRDVSGIWNTDSSAPAPFGGDDWATFLLTGVLCVVSYGVAGLGLLSAAAAGFDRAAGRPVRSLASRPPVKPPLAAVSLADPDPS